MVKLYSDDIEKRDLLRKIEDLHKEFYSSQLQIRSYLESVKII